MSELMQNLQTTGGKPISVWSTQGGAAFTVGDRKVLSLPRGAADDLAEALRASNPFGRKTVAATDDGTAVSLLGVNDQVSIIKKGRRVLQIAIGDRFALAELIDLPKESSQHGTVLVQGGQDGDVLAVDGGGESEREWVRPIQVGPLADGPSGGVRADGGADSPGPPDRSPLPSAPLRESGPPGAGDSPREHDKGGARSEDRLQEGGAHPSGGQSHAEDAWQEGVPGVPQRVAKAAPTHRSNSQIKTYGLCGHRYYLERLVENSEPERPNTAALAGTALHTVREKYERHAWLAYKQPFKTLTKAWPTPEWAQAQFYIEFSRLIAQYKADNAGTEWAEPDSWYCGNKGKETIAWWYENGPEFARGNAVAQPEDRRWQTLALDGKLFLELEMRHEIAGVEDRGFLDWATIDDQGYVDVTDYKSGMRPNDRGLQVVKYAHVLARQYPHLKVRGGTYYNLRTNEETYYRLDSWSWEDIEHVYRMADHGITSGVFLPVVDRHCSWCSVSKSCSYGGKR